MAAGEARGEAGRRRAGRRRRVAEVSLDDCRELDRDSEVPLYYQLGAVMLESLEAHPWPAGARFATERDLEVKFGVSRVVVRRALELLEGDGAIYRRQGSGAYIAPRRQRFSSFGLLALIFGHDDETRLRVLRTREERPDSAVSRFLALRADTPIFHLNGVLERPSGPVALLDSHVPIIRAPWIADACSQLVEGRDPSMPAGVLIGEAEVVVEHTFFSSWGGPTLGESAGDPALMTRVLRRGVGSPRMRSEAPLEFAKIFYPARTSQISFEAAGSRDR